MFKFDDTQRDAVNKMHTGSILSGKVGSGKSRTALAYFFTRECGGSFEPSYSPFKEYKDLYIITTAKKRDDKEWEEEIEAFDMFKSDISKINITIDSWNNIKKYVDVENSFFIFDEQKLVGKGTWVQTFLKMTSSGIYSRRQHNNNWILLSATPGDRWEDYIPVFIANGFYRTRTDFLQQHAVFNPYVKFQKIDKFIGQKRLYMLRESILVDIPIQSKERIIEYVKVEYDKDTYKTIAKDRWNIFKNQPIPNAAEFCYCLRKAVNMNTERILAIKNIYKDHPRLIIFYNFDYELEMLRIFAKGSNIEYSEWNGHVHGKLPTSESWLYFVQYTAGCEGWNCTTTDTIVFFSLNYSYRITEQSSGRIDRRDSPYSTLNYFFLITDAWIDRAIKNALQHKKSFNKQRYFKDWVFE